jgi:hypothetical protein
MAARSADQIGDLGEWLAAVDFSRPVKRGYKRPLFRPTHLGGKYPAVDFIVDILALDGASLGFLFVQVKSTTLAPTPADRLPIVVAQDHFNRLVRLPAPTYLVGVDVTTERCYLAAAYKRRRSAVPSITTAYNLAEDAVKISLYKEVIAFWKVNKPLLQNTRFKDV